MKAKKKTLLTSGIHFEHTKRQLALRIDQGDGALVALKEKPVINDPTTFYFEKSRNKIFCTGPWRLLYKGKKLTSSC